MTEGVKSSVCEFLDFKCFFFECGGSAETAATTTYYFSVTVDLACCSNVKTMLKGPVLDKFKPLLF